MSELDKIEADRPNVVIEGRGRLKREFFPSGHTFSKIVEKSTTYTFNIQVFNDDTAEMECELDKQAIMPSGWAYKIKNSSGTEITTFPHSFTIDKSSYSQFTVELTTPTTIVAGELSTICIFVKKAALDDDRRDSCKILCSPALLSFTDVEKEIEMLINDETIHPSTATYSAQDYANEIILRESSIILSLSANSLFGNSFPYIDLAREIILGRIVSRTLRKAAAYSLGGERFYITLAESYDKRTDNALSKLMSRCMGEGMQSKTVRVIPPELTNVG